MSFVSRFLQSPASDSELQRFSHKHLLSYRDERTVCVLCSKYNDDVHMYGCTSCNRFAHTLCLDQTPRYIPNSLHPMHPLELYMRNHNEFNYCSICRSYIHASGYKCSSSACHFYVDIECATENTFEPKDHEHSFRIFKPTLFTCDACGIDEDSKSFSCVCSICLLQVHQRCREIFPVRVSVRQRMHPHELKLRYSFEIEFDYTDKFCKICSRKMNNVLCLYQCKDGCAYIAHASCATSKNFLMETGDYGHHGTLEVEEVVEVEEIETEQVITHFSHPHTLSFSNIEPENKAVCYGCVQPISAVPFYTCDSKQCNFFLHKKCSELPKTIQSPIHQHPLALKDFLDLNVMDIIIRGFSCKACRVRCNGFAYVCTKCDEIFDVGCSLFGYTLNHESHKCTLTMLSTDPNDEKRCVACDSTFYNAFWCEECNFFLDLKCASLPKTVGHACPTGIVWSIKPLKLWYDCIEHVGGQYYCDLCEETRGKDLWFYYCEDCRDSIHPRCVLGDDRFMYGKSFNITGHCHTVCVAKKPKTHTLCDTCGEPCEDSPLAFCPTCNVYFHGDRNCSGKVSSGRKPIRNYWYDISSSPNEIEDEEDEDDREIVVEQVNHFSHPHNLIIGEDDRERLHDEVCDGCGMPISVPFYKCVDKKGKCNYFLHKECFELPKQIQHPFHPDHPLILDLPGNDGAGFTCDGCGACSNCFVYTCRVCKFFLDVRCSLMPDDTLVHESHGCTLTLINKNIPLAEKSGSSKGERKCNACKTDCCSYKYICDECNFELGLRCASLPKMVTHECAANYRKIRPRHLRYAASENGSYYCCDKRCDRPEVGNELVYHCEDCRHTTHARCSIIRSNLIKSGVVYQAYNHLHNLITVKNEAATTFKSCQVCKEKMKDSPAVYCKECHVYIHIKCCREIRRA